MNSLITQLLCALNFAVPTSLTYAFVNPSRHFLFLSEQRYKTVSIIKPDFCPFVKKTGYYSIKFHVLSTILNIKTENGDEKNVKLSVGKWQTENYPPNKCCLVDITLFRIVTRSTYWAAVGLSLEGGMRFSSQLLLCDDRSFSFWIEWDFESMKEALFESGNFALLAYGKRWIQLNHSYIEIWLLLTKFHINIYG